MPCMGGEARSKTCRRLPGGLAAPCPAGGKLEEAVEYQFHQSQQGKRLVSVIGLGPVRKEAHFVTLEARMMTKVYLFLRNYLPKDLIGSFGHIRSDEVLDNLIGHTDEQAASRYTIIRDADAVSSLLEQ